MNHIETIRSDIKRDFNETTFREGDFETYLSPSCRYRLYAANFWSKEPNWDLTRVQVYDQENDEKLVEFFVNDSRFFYGWATVNNREYLICSEDILGGQTVVNLTNRQIAGYSPNEDGFIWTDFQLSPDGKTLATIGCYWGSNYFIRLFDFSTPMDLPLKELKDIALLDNDEVMTGWSDNSTLKMKGIKREREPEYDANGSSRMKTISEVPVERDIDIYNL